MPNARFSRRIRKRLGRFLVALVLVQSMAPALAQPRPVTEPGGHLVLLCTLQGLKAVWIAQERQEEPAAPDPRACPACLLVQLLSAGLPVTGTVSATVAPTGLRMPWPTVAVAAQIPYGTAHIRAPPRTTSR